MVGLSLGLLGALLLVLWYQEEPFGIWVFASPLLFFSLYAAMVFSLIEVEFDDQHVIAMTPLLRWQIHAWKDLVKIETVQSWAELRLHFTDGRIARVSLYFNGLEDFYSFARAKLQENAIRDGGGVDEIG